MQAREWEGSVPVLDLVGAFHVVDVHADLVVDVGRELGAVGPDVREDDPGPELPVVQQPHGFVHQPLLVRHRLQLIQVHTLHQGKTHRAAE